MSSGRHRRPGRASRWIRSCAAAVTGSLGRLARSGQRARLAALDAEVIALRLTVTQMREAVAAADARADVLAAQLTLAREQMAATTAELAATRELLTALPHGPATAPVVEAGPPAALELPLVRLALARTAGRTLDREMAAALAAPDRGTDTARTEIVLPERDLLDPATARAADLKAPVDPAAAATGTPVEAGARRIA